MIRIISMAEKLSFFSRNMAARGKWKLRGAADGGTRGRAALVELCTEPVATHVVATPTKQFTEFAPCINGMEKNYIAKTHRLYQQITGFRTLQLREYKLSDLYKGYTPTVVGS